MPLNTIDLCAGIGGIRKGFEMTGHFENVLSAEIDKFACKTYRHLYGDDANNDLTKEAFKQTVVQTPYDVLLAGFPCQTFSRAGLEEGFNDTTKGTIFYHIADIIRRTNKIIEHPKELSPDNKSKVRYSIKYSVPKKNFKDKIRTLYNNMLQESVSVFADEDKMKQDILDMDIDNNFIKKERVIENKIYKLSKYTLPTYLQMIIITFRIIPISFLRKKSNQDQLNLDNLCLNLNQKILKKFLLMK